MEKYLLYLYRDNQILERFDIQTYDNFSAIKKSERLLSMTNSELGRLYNHKHKLITTLKKGA